MVCRTRTATSRASTLVDASGSRRIRSSSRRTAPKRVWSVNGTTGGVVLFPGRATGHVDVREPVGPGRLRCHRRHRTRRHQRQRQTCCSVQPHARDGTEDRPRRPPAHARRPRSGTRSRQRQRQCLWASVRLADPNWWSKCSRTGLRGIYGQIRHRHLLLLQRGRPLMQNYSQLMAHPTGTLESIAVRTAVNTLTSPNVTGARQGVSTAPARPLHAPLPPCIDTGGSTGAAQTRALCPSPRPSQRSRRSSSSGRTPLGLVSLPEPAPRAPARGG